MLAMKYGLIFILSLHAFLYSDIKSLGELNFDVQNDGKLEATLTTDGLGLGVTNPAANLHVAGNAIISDQLIIGASTANSNLHINGTISQVGVFVSDNQTLPEASLIFVDTSAGNVSLRLPNTDQSINRKITIKKTSPDYSMYLWDAKIDGLSEISFGPNSDIYPHIELISTSANQWYILNSRGETNTVSSTNLIAYYRLDESSGTTIYDFGENGLNGTLTNSSSDNLGVSGQVDLAIEFDGEDDQVIVSDSPVLDDISDEITVCFWVKDEDQAADSGYICKEISSGRGWGIEDGRFFIWADSGNMDNSYDDIDDDEWHHMAYTWDGTDSHIYRDGQLIDSLTDGAGSIRTNDDPLILGYSRISGNDERYLNGKLDDVRIYSEALDAEDIHTIYSLVR